MCGVSPQRLDPTTTNKAIRWTQLLAPDEALTAAILDRLLHKAHVQRPSNPATNVPDYATADRDAQG